MVLRLWETPSGCAQVGWLTPDPQAPADARHLVPALDEVRIP